MMNLQRLLLSLLGLVSVASQAWEIAVGGGFTRPVYTTDLINTTVKIDDYRVDLDGGIKAYARFNFAPYFGVQAEVADYGGVNQTEIISSTINNVTRDATINFSSDINATNYSFFIGSNRDDFFAMFGKFGISQYRNQLNAQVLDNLTTPGTEVYLRNEKISENAPLLGFGISFRLPWNIFILAEYEIINGENEDIESANAMVEYRF